jgi:hypothetical protein
MSNSMPHIIAEASKSMRQILQINCDLQDTVSRTKVIILQSNALIAEADLLLKKDMLTTAKAEPPDHARSMTELPIGRLELGAFQQRAFHDLAHSRKTMAQTRSLLAQIEASMHEACIIALQMVGQ